MGGAKTIGLLGSVAVLVNNLLGPGIASLASSMNKGEWFPGKMKHVVQGGAMSYRLEAAGMCMIGRRQQAGRHLGRYVMQGGRIITHSRKF